MQRDKVKSCSDLLRSVDVSQASHGTLLNGILFKNAPERGISVRKLMIILENDTDL